MFTNSLPSFSLPPKFLKSFDDHHQTKPRHAEGEDKHHKLGQQNNQEVSRPDKVRKSEDVATINSKIALQSVQSSESNSADIQIETKEGDIVTISLSNAARSSTTALNLQQGNTEINAYAESFSYESDFNIMIEGDLNEDEQQSIAELVNKINKVSNKFFNGNVQSAFRHAQNIGIDSQQIAGFSMDLNHGKSVQAISAYQQTTAPEQSVQPDLLQTASDFITESKDFLSDVPQQFATFAHPENVFNELFDGVGQQYDDYFTQEQGSEYVTVGSLFSNMVELLGKELF